MVKNADKMAHCRATMRTVPRLIHGAHMPHNLNDINMNLRNDN